MSRKTFPMVLKSHTISGGGVAAKLPDIYGRKKILLIALVLMIIFSTAAPLAQNKETFFIVRSLVGLSMGLTGPVALTLTAEMVKSSHREIGPLCLSFSHFLGPFIVAIFAYLLLNLVGWRWFIVTQTVVPLIICLILAICFLPESPRYFMVSGQKEEALETLQHMAKKNGVCLPPLLIINLWILPINLYYYLNSVPRLSLASMITLFLVSLFQIEAAITANKAQQENRPTTSRELMLYSAYTDPAPTRRPNPIHTSAEALCRKS